MIISTGAWGATVFRDELVSWTLGAQYAETSNVFAVVALAQCFVVLGYACALLLNSVGDFRLQQRYYVWAAIAMVLAVVPAASLYGVVAVALVYFAVRGVDLLLLWSAVLHAGRRVRMSRTMSVCAVWATTSFLAWFGEPVLVIGGGVLMAVMMFRVPLTLPAARS
jgi:O-antigen/teichoic acid export membrane protein